MRIQTNSKRKFLCSIFVGAICATLVTLGSWSFAESQLDKTVTEAYELRMNGKADEAEAKLEQLLAENPNNAPAHYELARTKFHLGLSSSRELVSSIEEAQNSIEQAIKNDPENVIYYFFAGSEIHMDSLKA